MTTTAERPSAQGVYLPEPALVRAVRFLAGRCDGAEEQDGRGFNKSDTGLGRLLAATPPDLWTTRDQVEMHARLKKYRGQLSEIDIAFESLRVPSEHRGHDTSVRVAADRFSLARRLSAGTAISHLPTRVLTVAPDGFVFTFNYSGPIVAAMRSLKPYARYQAHPKPGWVIPFVVEAARVVAIAAAHDFLIEDAAAAKLVELDRHPVVGAPIAAVEQVTRRQIAIMGGAFQVRFEYNPDVIESIKSMVPSAKYDKGARAWTVPALYTPATGLADFINANRGFEVTDEAASTMGRLVATHSGLAEQSRAADAGDFVIDGLPDGLTPYPFQVAGVRYGLQAKRLIIGDEMGLGKTIQGLLILRCAKALPALILCPSSLKLNWYREARKWLPAGTMMSVIEGTKASTAAYHADVIIMNYDIVHAHVDGLLKRGLRAILCDEAHALKNGKARRTKAVEQIADACEYRILMSGTAILNKPAELISPLKIIGRLNDLGGWRYFTRHYCDARKTAFGLDMSGAANLGELNERLRAVCYVRREKAQVLKELPAKTRAIVPMTIDNRAAYNQVRADVVAWIRQQEGAAAAMKADKAQQIVKIERLKQMAAMGMLKGALEWIGEFIEAEKLIVFASHVAVQKAIVEAFPGCVRILGEDDSAARQTAVDRFQKDPACRLIVCSLTAAGVGWTGTSASHVAFVELGWTPSLHDQAEDRAHRIGQENPVTAWYLLAQDTIYEDVWGLIESKRKVVSETLVGGSSGGASGNASILSDLVSRLSGSTGLA